MTRNLLSIVFVIMECKNKNSQYFCNDLLNNLILSIIGIKKTIIESFLYDPKYCIDSSRSRVLRVYTQGDS